MLPLPPPSPNIMTINEFTQEGLGLTADRRRLLRTRVGYAIDKIFRSRGAFFSASGGPVTRGGHLSRGLRATPRRMRCGMGGLRAAVPRSTSPAAAESGLAHRRFFDAGRPRRSRPRGRCRLVYGQQRRRFGAGDAGADAGAASSSIVFASWSFRTKVKHNMNAKKQRKRQ